MKHTLNKVISFQALKDRRKLAIAEEGFITISVYKTKGFDTPFFFIEPDRRELLPIVEQLEKTLSHYKTKA